MLVFIKGSGLQRSPICSLPRLPKLSSLPRLQAKKNIGATEVAEKVDVDTSAPKGTPSTSLPKQEVRGFVMFERKVLFDDHGESNTGTLWECGSTQI